MIGKPEEVSGLVTMVYSQADILSWWHSDGCEQFVAMRVERIILMLDITIMNQPYLKDAAEMKPEPPGVSLDSFASPIDRGIYSLFEPCL